MKEIKIILNEGEKVKLGDEVLTVREFDLQTIPSVIEYFDHIYSTVDQNKIQKAMSSKKGGDDVIVMELMKAIGFSLKDKLPTVLRIVGACCNYPVSDLQKLPLDAVLQLVKIVIEVNYNFLSQRVMPIVNSLFAEIAQKENKNPTGPSKSKN